MYCSSCGASVPPGLSYCNRCGTELSAKADKSKLGMPLESLVWAFVAVAVVGLGANIGLMALMKELLHFENGLILGISIVSFLPFLAAEAVFLWLLLRSQVSLKPLRQIVQPRAVTTNELDDAQPRVLQAPPPNVTEHTTHTLEPARIDRKTQ